MNPKSTRHGLLRWQQAFLRQQDLDPAYLQQAQLWFDPLAKVLASQVDGDSGKRRIPLVAVNGCQGSGKTTLCDYLVANLLANYGLNAVALSLDDFYLTRQQRRLVASEIHPLLATRGVPGTHDMVLLAQTLDALQSQAEPGALRVPRFDKSTDDRRPDAAWQRIEEPVDLVLLEGWCMGARPQPAADLVSPVNELERNEDPDGRWRGYVNAALARDFLPLYTRVSYWVMLQAPAFACVYRWRLEQEQKLASRAGHQGERIMGAQQVARFIQYYQRITERCLVELPPSVHYLYTLDSGRRITASHKREFANS